MKRKSVIINPAGSCYDRGNGWLRQQRGDVRVGIFEGIVVSRLVIISRFVGRIICIICRINIGGIVKGI